MTSSLPQELTDVGEGTRLMNYDPEVFGIGEAAAFLGAHEQTVRRLARRGAIPSFKVGKHWRFRKEALLRWADGQRECRASRLVLIVDDNEMICRALVRMVESFGCRAQSATDGRSGLEIVSRNRPDLVLLDLAMPGMDGPQFLEELRKTQPHLPVAIVTAYPDGDLMAHSMAYGPLMLLAKPVDAAQLQKLVTLAVGERWPVYVRPGPEALVP